MAYRPKMNRNTIVFRATAHILRSIFRADANTLLILKLMYMSLELIKQLREKTGAGMADCKKALDESGGDLDQAVEVLRKRGIAKAAKREGREAGEGIIKLAVNEAGNEGYMVEVNAETDFVVRNEKFQNFTDNLLRLIMDKKPKGLDELNALPMGEYAVKETLDNLSGTIGEKMDIKGFDVLSSAGTVAAYSHLGGKIGVLAALSEPGKDELAKKIAMQIAAVDPKYITPDEVPAAELDKEKEIYKEQLLKEGKPENIIDKIIEGKVGKYYGEVCLVKQEFIMDDKKKVEDILEGAKVEKFIRYSLS